MEAINLTCVECKKTAAFLSGRKSSMKATSLAFNRGWRMSRGHWFCSAKCAVSNSRRNDALSEAITCS
jgi:hypothetical protein